jgi:predicted nucleic acid-binding protein
MKIVVDVNPILSALIKDSSSRKIIVNPKFEFHFPEPALQKIRKYKSYIIEKSGLSELEYLVMLYTLLNFITLVSTEKILQYWREAKEIMGHIDPEDVAFIAASLSNEKVPIWSDDAHFKKQNKIVIFTTKDLIDLLDKEGIDTKNV